MPATPGSANASAATMPGNFPDHIRGPMAIVTWVPDTSNAADTTTAAQSAPQTAVDAIIAARRITRPDTSIGHGMSGSARSERATFLRIVVTKRRERRLDRRRLGTIFLMAGQTGHHHVEQLGIDKRQRIA